MGKEICMINTFKTLSFKDIDVDSDKCANNVQGGSGEKCDIALRFKKRQYFLEVKHSYKNNSSNYPKQMITEMIMNKKNHPSYFGHYSLFIDYDSLNKQSDLLSFCKNHIRKREWFFIGLICHSKVIFLFDENQKELFIVKWNSALNNNLNVIKIFDRKKYLQQL